MKTSPWRGGVAWFGRAPPPFREGEISAAAEAGILAWAALSFQLSAISQNIFG
jgi:hypothetical protein